MWNTARGRIAWSSAALSCGAVAACGKASSHPEGAAKTPVVAVVSASSACRPDLLRPSAVPPAEGVWSGQATKVGGGRVAVMLGPTELRGGSTIVTRSIEAIETGTQGREVRSRLDTAVVHLDLLPSYGSAVSRIIANASGANQPVAVYTISLRVLIAAYESCADAGAPAIRYLRRDEQGHIAIDAMLRRETEPPSE